MSNAFDRRHPPPFALAEMNSGCLAQFLRVGMILPLTRTDSKQDVEDKLGSPKDWQGRIVCFTWPGPALVDFHDSQFWSYGRLTVGFDEQGLFRGIMLDYG